MSIIVMSMSLLWILVVNSWFMYWCLLLMLTYEHTVYESVLTSSSLIVIMVKALNTHSVDPVIVMIRSGHEPSEILIRALLCTDGKMEQKNQMESERESKQICIIFVLTRASCFLLFWSFRLSKNGNSFTILEQKLSFLYSKKKNFKHKARNNNDIISIFNFFCIIEILIECWTLDVSSTYAGFTPVFHAPYFSQEMFVIFTWVTRSQKYFQPLRKMKLTRVHSFCAAGFTSFALPATSL